jgi:WD domain, G-beta repeat.
MFILSMSPNPWYNTACAAFSINLSTTFFPTNYLFRFLFQSLCHVYGGHSSHVTSVSFLHDDSRVISIGGKDTSVMQWQII